MATQSRSRCPESSCISDRLEGCFDGAIGVTGLDQGDQVRLLNGFTFAQQVTPGANGNGISYTTTGVAQMPGSPGVTGDDLILSGF